MSGQSATDAVVCPPDRYLASSLRDVEDSVKETLADEDPALVYDFVRLIEGVSQFEFLEARRRITGNLTPFLLASTGKTLPTRKGKKPPSDEELDERELRCVADVVALLQAAHFRLLTQEEWRTALAEEFTFTMPVEVQWDTLDRQLLSRYWAGRPEQRRQLADISDSILVFHRGIRTVRARGLYINEKIDLLVGYLIMQPFQRLVARLLGRAAAQTIAKVNPLSNGSIPDASGNMAEKKAAAPADPGLRHKNAKVVERKSLTRLMPNSWAVFSNLTCQVELQEPAFAEIIILYRRATPDAAPPQGEYEIQREHNYSLARRNITLKSFDEVPMADVEMIFPEKRLFLKAVTWIQLLITIIGGLAAAFGMLAQGKMDMWVWASALGLIGGRMFQVYSSANLQLSLMRDELSRRLYHRTQDSQAGVMHSLLNQMAEQHIKEQLLAYAVLLRHGGELSVDELDARCESFIEQQFGQRLDFGIEGALPALLRDGLVTQAEAGGRLKAAPLAQAVKQLNVKWDDYFVEGGENAVLSIPGASGLTQQKSKKESTGIAGVAGGLGRGMREGLTKITKLGGPGATTSAPGATTSAPAEPSKLPTPSGSTGAIPTPTLSVPPPLPAQSQMAEVSSASEAAAGKKKKPSPFKKLFTSKAD